MVLRHPFPTPTCPSPSRVLGTSGEVETLYDGTSLGDVVQSLESRDRTCIFRDKTSEDHTGHH